MKKKASQFTIKMQFETANWFKQELGFRASTEHSQRVSYGKCWTDKIELQKNVLIFSKYDKNTGSLHFNFEVLPFSSITWLKWQYNLFNISNSIFFSFPEFLFHGKVHSDSQWKDIFEYQIFPRNVNCILINSTGKEIENVFTLSSFNEWQALTT